MVLTHCPACGDEIGPADRYCEGCGAGIRLRRTPPDAVAGRDRAEYELGLVAGVSDRGSLRARNEDAMAFAVVGPQEAPEAVVAVVCDGVGSTEHADAAAQAAADAAVAALVDGVDDGSDAAAATHRAAAEAYAAVRGMGDPLTSAPSCTFVSAVATKNAITVGWIGDSRAYWVAESGSRLLTKDDADPVAGALTRWVGADAIQGPPSVVVVPAEEPGRLVVCSDGLWNYLPTAEELAAEVSGGPPLTVAAELTAVALRRGGHDNITVVVLPYPFEERA
ncbi:protein phosphatase 2C domain-containing protein [Kutzneria buriramensis]|uniref:Serine/threonine protein phosphatase PrpC n=1 Tax=Kutzneria buriramensis TaxID=1045776 RepID=A0A3E0HEJ1_9PSEU|nr:protein phosphatase 2C domain-containing protein [Kutzneria buriramensis]REH43466.1 serine/threonine protein phosphatase PrpC [Kutzneria buriramensis]